MQNIGWMSTISQALPLLYDHHMDYYVKELFYKPCFGLKQDHTDLSIIDSYEWKRIQSKNVHAVDVKQGLVKKSNIKNLGFKGQFINILKNLKQK